jgi:glutathione S-transferase
MKPSQSSVKGRPVQDEITIIGNPISPYVRKVLAILDMKGLSFRCIPLVPFTAGEDFSEISPLRRIPVLRHGDFILPDSSAIVQYLEELCPEPPVFPGDARERARARWFEEYADDHFGRSVIFNLFFQRVVAPAVLKRAPDEAVIADVLENSLPQALDYLEQSILDSGYLCARLSLADISIAAMMKNALWAGWTLDEGRWPRFADWLGRVENHPSLVKVNALADELRAAPPAEHAAVADRFLAAS